MKKISLRVAHVGSVRRAALLAALSLIATQGITQSSLQRSVPPPTATQSGGTAPSWGAPGSTTAPAGSANQASAVPRGVNRTTLAAGSAPAAPPAPRDCAHLVQNPNPSYIATNMTHWSTDGTEDNGQILNQIGAGVREVQGDLNDLQVRVAQLRCEDQNIEDKLDYIIRRLP
jgi:hypothetical protein